MVVKKSESKAFPRSTSGGISPLISMFITPLSSSSPVSLEKSLTNFSVRSSLVFFTSLLGSRLLCLCAR